MKVEKGIGGSVNDKDQSDIDAMNKEVRFDVCPTCDGSGKAELPDFTNVDEKVYWWFRKMKQALAKKPEGIELLLMNNQLVVIQEPKEEGILEPEMVRMHLGDAGKIKYITSEIKYQFDESDELPESVTQEDLRELAKGAMSAQSETQTEIKEDGQN